MGEKKSEEERELRQKKREEERKGVRRERERERERGVFCFIMFVGRVLSLVMIDCV